MNKYYSYYIMIAILLIILSVMFYTFFKSYYVKYKIQEDDQNDQDNINNINNNINNINNNNIEQFTSLNYIPWKFKLQPYELDPKTTYPPDSNYHKIWRGRETSDKDLVVSDLPIQMFQRILPFYNNMNKADIGDVEKYYKNIPRIKTKFPRKVEKDINDYVKNAEIVNNDTFSFVNKKTWANRSNQYNPNEDVDFPFIYSGIPAVDKIVVDFANKFNKNVFDQDFNIQNVHYSKYSVYQYKIIQLLSKLPNPNYPSSSSKSTIDLYRIIVVLVSNTSVVAPVLYIQGFVDTLKKSKNSSKTKDEIVQYYKIELIGTMQTSNLFQADYGNNIPENKYQYMNIDYTDQSKIVPKTREDIERDNNEVIDKQRQYNLEEQYACFNAAPDLFDNLDAGQGAILRISNSLSNAGNGDSRVLCEARTDWYGNKKPYGIWDKPCKRDEECIFYKANENYPNDYGTCGKNGYCELPVNMLHLGYHFYVQNEKNSALCYNCNNKEWKPISDLAPCCEEQKDKKKYPFLKSPDYAFANDVSKRENYYRLRKFL